MAENLPRGRRTSSEGMTAENIRNIALAGSAGAGKTSLIEAILHLAGCSDRLGSVDAGTSIADFDTEEIKRRMSIHLATAPCDWNDRRMTWVDTPAYPDFYGDFLAALSVVDDVLLVTPPMSDSTGEIDYGLERAWDAARARGKAEAVLINKMDRENADFFATVTALREHFGRHVVAATIPIGAGENFRGVVDLVRMKAYLGADAKEAPIPSNLLAVAEEWHQFLAETAAEGDDELTEEYLDGQELTPDEIERGIHEDMLSGRIVPVFCGSATREIGIRPLLTHLAREFEAPIEAPAAAGVNPTNGHSATRACDPAAPFSARVFKTIADPYVGRINYLRVLSGTLRADSRIWNANREQEEKIGGLFVLSGKQQIPVAELKAGDIGAVARLSATVTGDTLCDPNAPILYSEIPFPEPNYAVALTAKTKADDDKLGPALTRIVEEDSGLRTERAPGTDETLLVGQGETHIEVAVGRLARLGANVTTSEPRVAYRETVSGSARAQGRHKKQTGGRGQFGDCYLTVESLGGDGFEFVDKIVGGAIPRQFIPAVEKGVREAIGRGIVAGYPVVGVRVTVDDGSFHAVDSSEAAFIMAGTLGFANAAKNASPALLEPVLRVEVTAPDAAIGDLMSDISGRRGQVIGIAPVGRKYGFQTIQAFVPQSEMQRYAIDLRSIARGRGSFRTEYDHYAVLPAHLAAPLIAEHEKRRAEGHAGPG